MALPRIPLLAVSMFFIMFGFSFVQVSLPFYVERVSLLDAPSTVRWTGWILGVSPLLTMLTTPLWIHSTRQHSPRAALALVALLQGFGMFLTALASTLPQLLVARILLGLTGPAAAFAFMIAGRLPAQDAQREIAALQSGVTLGLVLGPLAGATAASQLGFTTSFQCAALLLWSCAGAVHWRVAEPSRLPTARTREGTFLRYEVLAVCLLVMIAYAQIFFLSGVLPFVLPVLGVPPSGMLGVAGAVVFASGVALGIGSLAAPSMSARLGVSRCVSGCVLASSLVLAILPAASSPGAFGLLRVVQVLLVAPAFPLLMVQANRWGNPQAIGLVNSSRIAASFIGPVIATMLLASFSIAAAFVGLAVLGIASLFPLYWLQKTRS